ncbi:leucine-rich repeat extensin-like protein 3 [Helianthus annuus]|uniref:leucine-rich repeat extensin-like protein 3 n=1 Tax=Helianthus annuus TaxID=4232 RepID=UPI000B906A5E|nr:leucine-rich repeat extensin-like protein 3 [Helianthus annuus]
MSSSESGLSDTDDPMAIVSEDEIVPEPEIFTSDTESDPELMSADDDDFHPFALPDFGDDLPLADGILDEDLFVIPIPVHDHLIIGYPDGEHIVAPILAPVPLVVIPPEDWPFDDLFGDDFDLFVDGPPDNAHGDGELDEEVFDIPLLEIPVIEISSDSSLHSVSDSFESVTSSALQVVGLRCYATDSDDDTTMSAAPSPPHDFKPGLEPDFVPDDQPDAAPADPEPILAPEPLPDHDPIPFGLPDIALLIPDPVPAPADPPIIEPVTPPLAPAPADDIPAPHPGEGTSSQQPSQDPHVSAAYPHVPQSAPYAHFTSSPLDEPLRWFPPYTMPISDPYHPSHFTGYTRDELLLSLQLQYEIMSRRILELEMTPQPLPCPCRPTFVPPRSSPSPFSHPPAPLTPFPEFDTRFLIVEQQISYLLHHVYDLEEELAHVHSLLFVPPPPPPPQSA